MSAASLIMSGIGGSALGAFYFTKGHAQNGMKSILLGLSAVNIGGRFHGLDSKVHGEVMKCAFATVTGTMGIVGAIQLVKSVKQKNTSEIIKQAALTLTGVVGSMLAYSLDSRILVVAHQASVLGATSTFIAIRGFKDLAKGRYESGLFKMALGVSGIASTVFYVYNFWLHIQARINVEQKLFPFIGLHREEIEEMYETRVEAGQWKKFGKGVGKVVFIHEDFPGWVLKIPNTRSPEDVRIHYESLKEVSDIASHFDHISLPESHLYPTAKGVVLIEEIFKLKPYDEKSVDQQEAGKQLKDFAEAVGLCDLQPERSRNAGIIVDTTPPRMGIIDFDCRKRVGYLLPYLFERTRACALAYLL